jgi:acid phosphatase (class A)
MRDAKNFNKRQRPFLIDKGETCIVISPDFAKSYDYPSGHATLSWTLGLVLAEIAPDRATQILARARAFGESRIVCGVHNASAVDAGRTEASIVVAALHSSADFRTDLEAARSEPAEARAKAAAPANCDAENALVAQPLY